MTHILSLLPTESAKLDVVIGTTSELPPTSASFTENPKLLAVLHDVLAKHAYKDPTVIAQAAAMASTAGSAFLSGSNITAERRGGRRRGPARAAGDGAGAASSGATLVQNRGGR